MMSPSNIQYVMDQEGNTTSVIVPIELWREMTAEDETEYLLKSAAMRRRLMEAIHREESIPFEVVREKLGI